MRELATVTALLSALATPAVATAQPRQERVAARAQGRTGVRTLVTVVPIPERNQPDFLEGLYADLDGDYQAAVEHYQRAERMGGCAEGTRCSWHHKLSADILTVRSDLRMAPNEHLAHNSLAITCANKIIALRLDTGIVPPGLRAEAERHYNIARDLAPAGSRNEVLLGLAALHGELGEEDRARAVFAGVRVEDMESSTDFGNFAYFLTTVGEEERAFVYLEKALTLDVGGRYRAWATTSDDFHRVKDHPRFKAILALY